MTKHAPRHPAVIATAVALPVALVIGVIVAAVLMSRSAGDEPVALSTIPAPQAESESCRTLIEALPDAVGDYQRAPLADPAPAGAAAWTAPEGEPVVLRCGLDRPAEFTAAAALQVVNEVEWFEVSGAAAGLDASTWFAVDRGVYIALTLPNAAGPTPLQDISNTIAAALPKQAIDPAPVR
jgi:hypothetical protein